MSDANFVPETVFLLEDQLQTTYEDLAFKLVDTLQKGLSNIHFEENDLPKEIKKIKDLIMDTNLSSIKNLPEHTSDRHNALAELINSLSVQIHALRANVDFDNLQANNFIFQAQNAFDGLSWFVITDYVRFVEKYFNINIIPENPSENADQTVEKKSFRLSALVPKLSKRLLKEIFNRYNAKNRTAFETDYLTSFEEIGTLLKNEPSKISPRGQSAVSQKLKSVLPTLPPVSENPLQIQSLSIGGLSRHINDSMDINIHNLNFDSYYTQIALYMEMQIKIEKIHQLTPNSSRSELYSSYGLEEGATTEVLQFFNSIAMVLGFNNATDLYFNYVHLSEKENQIDQKGEWITKPADKSSEAAERFYKIKKGFFQSHVQKKGDKNATPLALIENAYLNEQARMQKKREKAKNGSFEKNNYLYLSSLNYVTKIFVPSVKTKLKVQGFMANVLVPAVGNDQPSSGIVSSIALNAVNALLPHFDITQKALNDVTQNSITLEQMLSDANNSITHSLQTLEIEKKHKKSHKINEYFSRMLENNHINTEKMVTEYGEKASSNTGLNPEHLKNFETVASLKILELNTLNGLKTEWEKIVIKIESLEKEKSAQSLEKMRGTQTNDSSVRGDGLSFFKRLKTGLSRAAQKIKLAFVRVKDNITQKADQLAIALRIKPTPLETEATHYSKIDAELAGLRILQKNLEEQMILQKDKDTLSADNLIAAFSKDIEEFVNIHFILHKNLPKVAFGLQKRLSNAQCHLLATQNAIVEKVLSSNLTKEQLSTLLGLNEQLINIDLIIDPTSLQESTFRQKIYQNANQIEEKLVNIQQDFLLKTYYSAIDNDLPHYLENDINNFIPNVILDFLPRPSLGLNNDSLKKYYAYLQEKLLYHLNDHKANLPIEDIETLYEHAYALGLKFSLNHEQTNTDITTLTASESLEVNPYANLIKALAQHIEEKNNPKFTHAQHEKRITDSTQHLLNQIFKLNASKKELDKKVANQQSWVSNPMGLDSYKNEVIEASQTYTLNQSLLREMLNRNAIFCQNYLEKLQKNPKPPSSQEIKLEISQLSRLKNEIDVNQLDLPTKLLFEEMISLHEKILKQVLSFENVAINEELEKDFLKLFTLNTESTLSPAPEIGLIEKTGLKHFLPGFLSHHSKAAPSEALHKIRTIFVLQEKLQNELLQKLAINDPQFKAENQKIHQLRDNLIHAIQDNQPASCQTQIQEQIKKWDEEVEIHFKAECARQVVIFSEPHQTVGFITESANTEVSIVQRPEKPDI